MLVWGGRCVPPFERGVFIRTMNIASLIVGSILMFSPFAGETGLVSSLASRPVTGKDVAIVSESQSAQPLQSLTVWVTAYSSTPDQTDNTPFITASGKAVRDGIIAANFLPFGTKIKIPKFFGDKVFTVEDRMHRRKSNFIDIWMPTREHANRFGIGSAEIIVIDENSSNDRLPLRG